MTHCMHNRTRQRLSQRGAFIIAFALLLVVLIGFTGIAIDIAQIYNRKAELQNVADGAALAAARELNGTGAGILNAAARAGATAQLNKYSYFHYFVSWDSAALRFSAAANGQPWLDVSDAQASPAGVLYAKVDTSALAPAHGTVSAAFLGVLSPDFASTMTSAKAVAGRPTLAITPLAVCAQNLSATSSLAHGALPANAEQLEFGFRRGVGYNLMAPPPVGPGPQTFLINPIERPNDTCVDAHLSSTFVAPYMRAGMLLFDKLSTANTVFVSNGFPSSLTAALNTRFNQYAGVNTLAIMSPPDSNVKTYTTATASWMTTAPATQTAFGTSWGVLWSYAIPLHASAPNAPFVKADWATLYSTGTTPTANASYPPPPGKPYTNTAGPYFLGPVTNKSTPQRRMLVIPLLDCTTAPPAAGSCQSATVAGYGRFLMTVPADAAGIYAEFGGAIALSAAPSSNTAVLFQ